MMTMLSILETDVHTGKLPEILDYQAIVDV